CQDVIVYDAAGNPITSFGASSAVRSAVPATAAPAGWSDGVNLRIPRAFDADSGPGTEYVRGLQLRPSASRRPVQPRTAPPPHPAAARRCPAARPPPRAPPPPPPPPPAPPSATARARPPS